MKNTQKKKNKDQNKYCAKTFAILCIGCVERQQQTAT